MFTLYEYMAQARIDDAVRDAHHPARRAAHELRLAQRGARTARTRTRTRALGRAVRSGLPAATAWIAALVAVVS
jgi:hypothetical protein